MQHGAAQLLCRAPGVLPRPCSASWRPLLPPHGATLGPGRRAPRAVRPTAAAAAAGVEIARDGHSEARARSWWAQATSWWHLESPTPQSGEDGGRTPLLPLVRKILGFVAQDRLMLVAACVFMSIAALAELAVPHFATSCIFSAAAPGATPASYQGNLSALAGIIIIYGIMSAFRGYCFSILNNRMTMRLRTQLFTNLVCREVAFFDATDTGALTSRLQADCQAMTKCVATNLNIAFRNMLQAIGGVAYLAATSPVMCAATLGVCAVLWSITLLYGEYARRTQKIFQDTLACANQVADEVLSLSKVVRTFGTEGHEQGRYASWLSRLYQVGLRQATGYGMFVASGHIACYMTKVVALALGCALLLQGQLTAEQLTNFIFYVEFVTYASLSACDEVVEVMEAVGASERVLSLLEGAPAPQVAAGVVPASFSGRVEFRDVSFRYPSRPGHPALTDVNLTLAPGQLVALVGLSGSGKTTLVALLQRLYDPSSGSILVDGHDLRDVDASWYRSQIGVVSQDPRLFGTTIAENIAYGCPGATREAVEAAAREANASGFIEALPLGYDTPVTDRLLSGGQKQRIALARALVRNPRLLILDEATSALDAESEALVQGALDAAMASRARTVIVIAHRLSTVRHADVTVVMDRGQIVERGDHSSLVAQRGIYWRLVSRQAPGSFDLAAPLAGAVFKPDVVVPALPSTPVKATPPPVLNVHWTGNGAVPTVAAAAVAASSGNGNGNGAAVGQAAEEAAVAAPQGGNESESPAALPEPPPVADPSLHQAAAAAVTAENELSSKVLGSLDAIDYQQTQM